MAFDPQAYLAANPDVAAAVARGDLTAESHYQNFGQYEGRDPGGATSGAQTNFWDATDWQAQQDSSSVWGRSADGTGMNNYFQANPDVAQEYQKVIAAGGNISPEDYAIQHYDNYGRFEGRGGVLPTGQTTFERQMGSPGGTFYDVYAGAPTATDVGVFVNPVRGQYSNNIGQYQQDYGNRYGQVGPWGQFLTYNDARAWADANKGNIDSYMTGYKPSWVDDSKAAWSGSQAGNYNWQAATQPGYRPNGGGVGSYGGGGVGGATASSQGGQTSGQTGTQAGGQSGNGLVQGVNVNQYDQNPYLSQMGTVLTNRVVDNLNRNVMPGIRSNAVAANGFGGSRQGVVEANAMKDANQTISDALTGAYFQDFTNQMNRNLAQYGQNQNFFSNQRGQDLQQLALGANLFQQGNQGWLSQGQGLLGLGQTQQQAPWQVINNANAGLGQWSGYGTTTSANQGGGAQNIMGGALAGAQLGSLWGGAGINSPVSTPQPLNANYSLSSGGSYGLQAPTGWGV